MSANAIDGGDNVMMETLRHIARHYVHACYHAMHQFGIPSRVIPDAFLILVALGLTVWLVLHVLVGRQAARKGQSFLYGFFFAIVTTPLIASMFIAFLRPLKTGRKVTRKRSSFGFEKGSRDRERVA